MGKAEIELVELYKEMQEIKEELQDYYHENSGFSNGADFSLGFSSRTKNIRERIDEIKEEGKCKKDQALTTSSIPSCQRYTGV